MDDVKGRLANRVQLTPDGPPAYLEAVEEALGAHIDSSSALRGRWSYCSPLICRLI